MDAHAHLLSLGWAGPGHSLDSRPHKGRRGLAYDPRQAVNNGNGLIKPLLVSQKKNTFGIGKKAHEPASGNEWWLKGFETALSNVGKSESERTSGTATPEFGRPPSGYTGKHVGLYGFFVKGAEMEGTIGSQRDKETMSTRRKKRTSETLDSQDESSTSSVGDERSVKTSKKRRSKERTTEFEEIGAFLVARDKDEKRRRRKQKADAFEEFQQVGEFLEARSSRRKLSPSGLRHSDHSKPIQNVTAEGTEDSAQERRRRKKERERRKIAKVVKPLQANSDKQTTPAPPTVSFEVYQHVGSNSEDTTIAKQRAKRRRS